MSTPISGKKFFEQIDPVVKQAILQFLPPNAIGTGAVASKLFQKIMDDPKTWQQIAKKLDITPKSKNPKEEAVTRLKAIASARAALPQSIQDKLKDESPYTFLKGLKKEIAVANQETLLAAFISLLIDVKAENKPESPKFILVQIVLEAGILAKINKEKAKDLLTYVENSSVLLRMLLNDLRTRFSQQEMLHLFINIDFLRNFECQNYLRTQWNEKESLLPYVWKDLSATLKRDLLSQITMRLPFLNSPDTLLKTSLQSLDSVKYWIDRYVDDPRFIASLDNKPCDLNERTKRINYVKNSIETAIATRQEQYAKYPEYLAEEIKKVNAEDIFTKLRSLIPKE